MIVPATRQDVQHGERRPSCSEFSPTDGVCSVIQKMGMSATPTGTDMSASGRSFARSTMR